MFLKQSLSTKTLILFIHLACTEHLYITDYTAYSISNCLSNILKPNAFTEENVPSNVTIPLQSDIDVQLLLGNT